MRRRGKVWLTNLTNLCEWMMQPGQRKMVKKSYSFKGRKVVASHDHTCTEATCYIKDNIKWILNYHPWQVIGTYLFHLIRETYLLVGYYPRFSFICKMRNTCTIQDVINSLKSIFGEHGIPERVVSDNSPQFDSYILGLLKEIYNL